MDSVHTANGIGTSSVPASVSGVIDVPGLNCYRFHLVDPGVGDVLRAPVAADRQAPRHLFAEASEGMADALANGLERRPAIAELRRLEALLPSSRSFCAMGASGIS